MCDAMDHVIPNQVDAVAGERGISSGTIPGSRRLCKYSILRGISEALYGAEWDAFCISCRL